MRRCKSPGSSPRTRSTEGQQVALREAPHRLKGRRPTFRPARTEPRSLPVVDDTGDARDLNPLFGDRPVVPKAPRPRHGTGQGPAVHGEDDVGGALEIDLGVRYRDSPEVDGAGTGDGELQLVVAPFAPFETSRPCNADGEAVAPKSRQRDPDAAPEFQLVERA